MGKIISLTLAVVLLFAVSALAQNKVVVVPLNSNKAAGNDGQVQYNDNGKKAGAEVYYDKSSGNVGIGEMNPTEALDVNGNVKATSFVGDGSALTNVIPRVAFHASASTDQTVPDTAWEWLNVNNDSTGENFDYGDNYGLWDKNDTPGDPSDDVYAFTTPTAGVYFFQAHALWDNANAAEVRNAIFIRVNNTDEVGEWDTSGGTDFFSTSISTTFQLQAGDHVSVRIYNEDAAPMDTFSQNGKYCYFSAFQVF